MARLSRSTGARSPSASGPMGGRSTTRAASRCRISGGCSSRSRPLPRRPPRRPPRPRRAHPLRRAPRRPRVRPWTVSYTHLTLPTICSV
eukprot:12536885-Alexandrium_andersonii.AAC.1